jgi:hypothetical protein
MCRRSAKTATAQVSGERAEFPAGEQHGDHDSHNQQVKWIIKHYFMLPTK